MTARPQVAAPTAPPGVRARNRVGAVWLHLALLPLAKAGLIDVTDIVIDAKSGVSGALLGAVPGALGLATWSPRLDEQGNSRRGIGLF